MVKKVLKIMLGNGSAQGLQLLFIPILTNHYSPIEFGELAQVIAYSSVLCIFLSLQLNVAIVATDKEDDIESIFGGYNSCFDSRSCVFFSRFYLYFYFCFQ